MVYHLHNWYENKRIKIKAFLTVKTRDKTISNIFEFQMEREPLILWCRFYWSPTIKTYFEYG
jgi:hypothetical protein